MHCLWFCHFPVLCMASVILHALSFTSQEPFEVDKTRDMKRSQLPQGDTDNDEPWVLSPGLLSPSPVPFPSTRKGRNSCFQVREERTSLCVPVANLCWQTVPYYTIMAANLNWAFLLPHAHFGFLISLLRTSSMTTISSILHFSPTSGHHPSPFRCLISQTEQKLAAGNVQLPALPPPPKSSN